ncbi:MAG TPA: exodeoxyribonuclease V subunit gamma, partial [Chitinivibrionales bacterium]|nr:exodeoxyribonuclease V subunit gamma [Chitinivibrionales bacterium]
EKGLQAGGWAVSLGHVFLFGVTKMSHFHRNTLVEISQMDGVTLEVFLTNPCAEFWEDVDARRSRSVRRSWKYDSGRKDAAIPAREPDDYKQENLDFANLPGDHPLLELWGGAGKENIFLWCPQAQWNFEYHSPAWAESGETPATLLKAVQYSLLRGQSALPDCKDGWTSDGSLLVLACPERGREIEELREQILDMVSAGKINTLNEAVVYVPDPAEYVAHIQRVFGAFRPGEPGHIPFSILAAPGSDSVFSQGMHVFLELAGDMFDRPRVFSFLANPMVCSSMEISVEDINAWERWAEALGIFRGFDRAHRQQMGDIGEAASDAHTFELGMARLLCGDLAAGPLALDYLLVDNKDYGPARIPPYRDFDTADRGRLEKFCCAVEKLHRDCDGLRTAAESGNGDPVAALTEITRRWFGKIPDSGAVNAGAEARVLRDFLDSLQSILPIQHASHPSGNSMFREFLALAGSCLPGELAGGSAAWTGGITFAPLRPAMIVPHRAVFAVGLGATAFPGTADRPGWDLLAHRRIVGDSDPVRDNRFAFLELFHAARERLVLSFVSRNMQKEQDLQPSSVVLELEAYLARQQPPVHAQRNIPWIVHESLDDICKSGRPHGSWDPVEITLARLAAEPGRTLHRYDLPHAQAPTPIAPLAPAALRTDIFSLRTFFANPLEYHLSMTLGIELDEEPPTADASDEPLESGALGVSSLEKEIWKELLEKVFPLEKKDEVSGLEQLTEHAQAVAKRVYADHVASGNSPEAQFLGMERQKLLQWAGLCAEATFRLREQFPDHSLAVNTDLSLGRKGVPGGLCITLQSGAACAIECRHSLALVPRKTGKAGGCVGIIDVKKEGKAADNAGLWLSGVLQWLSGMENSDGFKIMLVQINRGDGKNKRT